jgi:pyrroline-5-carboxylate reductase
MHKQKVGFVGGGRVARIILGGWSKSGQMPGEVVVSDTDPSALERLVRAFPSVRAVEDNSQAASQEIVLLAVHPPAIGDALTGVKASLKADAILVSLAPKLTIAKLTESLDGFSRIARMIPNAPSIVGQGYNPIAYAACLSEEDRNDVADLFSGLGQLPEVDEDKLEVYAILTAIGPTYLWPQLYELRSLADLQSALLDRYRTKLRGVMEKIRP